MKLIPELRFPEFKKDGEWNVDSLSSCADVIDPHTSHRAPTAAHEGVPFIGIGDISENGKLDWKNVRIVSKEILDEHQERYTLETGDFAYGRVASIGKVVDLSENIDKDYTYSPTMAIIQPSSIHSLYLKQFCNSEYFISQVNSKTTGSTRKSIGMQNLRILNVCLPESKLEQQKIASCLSSLDELIATHNDKLDALKNHKTGLLQNLFPKVGETVPKVRFPEFEGDGEWVEKKLGDIFDTFSGGTPKSTEKKYYGGSIPFIRSAEIAKDSTELFLTDEGLKNSSAKLVKKGDLLIALYGANSGDVAISQIGGAINQAILCLRSDFSNDFVSHYFFLKKEWIVRRYLQGGQGNLSGQIVKSIELYFPKKEEQQKIASCLSAVDKLITAQQEKIQQLQQHKMGLMQGLFPKFES